MAQVTVSVDDAVGGRFPPVCARTGERSDGTLRIDVPLRRPLRPWRSRRPLVPGATGARVLAIRVPSTEAAEASLDNRRAERTLLWVGALLSVAGLGTALAAPIGSDPGLDLGRPAAQIIVAILIGLTLTASAAAIVTGRRISHASIRVMLDASGQWVGLSGVHPAFADAVRAEQRRRLRRVPEAVGHRRATV